MGSEVTIRNNVLGKRSNQWNDRLVDFYKKIANAGNRYANAIHLYLKVNGQFEGLPNTQLIDNQRDYRVYQAVGEDIFYPRTEKLINETNLYAILTPHSEIENKSIEEKFLLSIFGSQDVRKVHDFIDKFLFQHLRESYEHISKKRKGRSEKSLDIVYKEVKSDIFRKIRQGLSALEDNVTREVFEARQKIKRDKLRNKIEAVLKTLSIREREIIKLRYGLGDGYTYSLNEVGQIYKLTREGIRQIEAKALRKLQHPSKSVESYEARP